MKWQKIWLILKGGIYAVLATTFTKFIYGGFISHLDQKNAVAAAPILATVILLPINAATAFLVGRLYSKNLEIPFYWSACLASTLFILLLPNRSLTTSAITILVVGSCFMGAKSGVPESA